MSSTIVRTQDIVKRFIRSGGNTPLNYEKHLVQQQWSRILKVLQGKVVPPYEVEIQPSSACNISCIWCIGESIQNANQVIRLPNALKKTKDMLKVVAGIVDYKVRDNYTEGGEHRMRDYRVETVKFSGFIGDPLVAKEATLAGMQYLSQNYVRVGLFTNGIMMDETTWDTIANAGFLHLSLDAGSPETFAYLKCKRDLALGEKYFGLIMRNLEGLAARKARSAGAAADLNVGYILNPYNYRELPGIAHRLKETGVNYLRLKIDIADQLTLSLPQIREAKELIGEVKATLVGPDFKLVETHQLEGPPDERRCFSRCYTHFLWGTVGSDGNVYPCDHNTYPGAPHYGNAINTPFREVWEGPMHALISRGLPNICPPTCSPFATRVNPFLEALKRQQRKHGLDGLEKIRQEIEGMKST
ncbi:MAG: SPASM domain-containing protein [Candidatus Margulisbacteria bacterium]|nr:SPASM domain-containing protein [Candidatus Margulisiibacteriota bacterium]MBU1616919.1 SPASM domain-containing protein [Candidatus Margulisiibacteriota bacterium]